MLNKRIKSLLVAGLLVFSMSGAVFAEGADLPKEGTIKIDYPDFGVKTFKEYKLQGGNIILKLYNDNNDYRADVRWNPEVVKVTGIKMTYEKAEGEEVETYSTRDIKLPDEVQAGQDCHVAVKEGDLYKVTNVADSIKDKKLIKVEIMFENLTKDDEPVVPPVIPPVDPEEPEEKIDDPETGDTSMMPIVVTAVASVAGLFVLNKKDDEE